MSSISLLPNWFIFVYIFVIGLCVGSFLNVLILRGLSSEDFIFKPSHCPKCQKNLKWYMNIPLFSYIFLKGKCAYCKEKISIQYPIVEFINALLYILIYLAFGLTLKTLFLCIIVSIFITLTTTDILETVIISYHAYALAIVGIIYSALNLSNIIVIESVLAGILGFIGFELVSRLGCLITKMRIFGEGDSFIVLGIGTIFGFKSLILIIALSLLIQSIFSLPIITFNTYKQGKIRLAISYLLVILSIFAILTANFVPIFNENQYLIFAVLLSIILIYCLINIMIEIKNKKQLIENTLDENNEEDFEKGKNIFTLMPFGPALIVSSLLFIFFESSIKKLIIQFLF